MTSTTYLMSYPGRDWHIRGGANFLSQARVATNPRAALKEWIALADTITRAGGHILVMPPAAVESPLTGLPYTANAGQFFRVAEHSIFLLSNMAAPHRQAERDFVRAFAVEAGLETRVATHRWEGQADLASFGGNRFIATHGPRSERAAFDEIRPLLPGNARVLVLPIEEPFFHGDLCVCALQSRVGDELLLVHAGAIVGATVESVRQFAGSSCDVLSVDHDDAVAFACNSLCVHGTVIMPTGISAGLRGQLARRGFMLEEIDLPELQGKGGGGPRCLVNELRGLVLTAGAPDYASSREQLVELIDQYPETVTPAPSGRELP